MAKEGSLVRRRVGCDHHPMSNPSRRPGDRLLDKYFPDADEATREAARDAFRKYAVLLVRWGARIEKEEGLSCGDDSTHSGGGVILESA